MPVVLSTVVRSAVVEPVSRAWTARAVAEAQRAGAPPAVLTERQREKIAQKLSALDQRLWYDGLTGRGEEPSEEERRALLQAEARRLEEEQFACARAAVCNCVSDLVTMSLVVAFLTAQRRQARAAWEMVTRQFMLLESATQAFFLLLVADTLVGYHSSDGWAAALTLLARHYGIVSEISIPIHIFVAIVPVSLDVIFKYWVFKYLRKLSPSTQIILDEIERH
mmetsp:Transcript_10339/g.36022  ORF Transcript_10339/g.36022 Transcript_10339/m.36022 type:complete len:223 (-) Transcript_10339:252-920(-)